MAFSKTTFVDNQTLIDAAQRMTRRPFRRQSTGLCKQDTAYAPEEYAAVWEVVE